MSPTYNLEEVRFAKKILFLLREKHIHWPAIKVVETAFFIRYDDEMWINISENQKHNSVSVDWPLYRSLMAAPHVTIHNHPSGKISPSNGDWLYARHINNHVNCDCLFHLITSPDFSHLCMFQYGKGILHIFNP